MSGTNQGRAGLTIQVPIPFFLELTDLAEALGAARHRLALLALHAGLTAAVDQLRDEQAAKATKPSSADAKE